MNIILHSHVYAAVSHELARLFYGNTCPAQVCAERVPESMKLAIPDADALIQPLQRPGNIALVIICSGACSEYVRRPVTVFKHFFLMYQLMQLLEFGLALE